MTPQAESVLELFQSTGAYLEGHFRLTSGLHSSTYLQCALVLQHPAAVEKLAGMLAAEIRKLTSARIELVVSPALGGVIIGYEVARALGTRFLFTERDAATSKMTLRRGFTVGRGEVAVVIEDVITTGGSTTDVIEVLKAGGVKVVAAGSIIDRSGGRADVGVPRAALATLQVAAHYPEECPLCQRGIPVVKPGSRPHLMRRIRIHLAYDGTTFHGWQVQPGLPTIQGALEEILTGMEGAPVHVAGSGRTDAGVHALSQVAAFSLENPIPTTNLRRAVNRLLPPTIRVLSAEEVDADFHPRFQAKAKTYEYRIHRGEVCIPFEWPFVHHYPYPLDEARMELMARAFEGEHDFTAFAASDDRDAEGRSKVRTIFSSVLERSPGRLVYRVRGSGFLKHMVRNIVGTLIEAGKGNVHDLTALPALSGPTAPAKGLFLVSVEYPDRALTKPNSPNEPNFA